MEENYGNQEGAVRPSKHEMESLMDLPSPIFDEYNELAIQYGYVVLFSAAFPPLSCGAAHGRARALSCCA